MFTSDFDCVCFQYPEHIQMAFYSIGNLQTCLAYFSDLTSEKFSYTISSP